VALRDQGNIRSSNEDCSVVDRKYFILNVLKSIMISHQPVSRVQVLEGLMEGKHLDITSTVTMNDREICTHQLTTCRATDMVLMDPDIARHYQIPLQE
jgi:hypothetical protein